MLQRRARLAIRTAVDILRQHPRIPAVHVRASALLARDLPAHHATPPLRTEFKRWDQKTIRTYIWRCFLDLLRDHAHDRGHDARHRLLGM